MSEQDSRPRGPGVVRGNPEVATGKTRAIAYVRVSTEGQAVEGVSLEAQQAKVAAYALTYDLVVVETVVEAGVSAKTLARPGLQRALELLRAGVADALLVVKLDRLTRSVRDLGELVDEHFGPGKAALLSVSEQIDTRTAGGRLVLNVLASVSQWEREAISERTSAALQHKASLGEYTGGEPPYGFRVVGDRIEEEPAEQAVVKAARALRGAGLSLRKVAAALTGQGLVSRAGKPFAAAQVARMVGPGSSAGSSAG